MSARAVRVWQVRLPKLEDEVANRLAKRDVVSKNDVIRRALRLLGQIEEARENGSRVLVERGTGTQKELVELWLV